MDTVMETMIVLQSGVDKHKFIVEEGVALQLQAVKDHWVTFKDKNVKEPTYRFPGITHEYLRLVIEYCKNHVNDDDDDASSFDIEFVKQLHHPVTLFNFIQAAHHLKIKSLMDLTCRALVNKVKTKTYGEIMVGFNIRQEYLQPPPAVKRVKRIVTPEGLQNSEEESGNLNFNILRNCRPETFVMESEFLEVQFSPFVTSQTHFINRRSATYDRYVREIMESRNFEQLLEPINHLENLINGDLRLGYRLRSVVVRYLVMILKMTNRKRMRYIQCQAVSILSRARFEICGDVLEKDVVPLLVKLLPNYGDTLATEAVIALTRLAYASPIHVKVIIDNGALEAVHELINKVCGTCNITGYVIKFLVAVCRGYSLYPDNLPSDKVVVVLTDIEDLFYKKTVSYRHLVLACYALLYLSHGRCVALTGEAYKRLIGKLTDFISIANTSLAGSAIEILKNSGRLENLNKIAGSALGVVGNIARWGTRSQIQALTKDHRFMQCVGKDMLCSEFKKFRKEACKIVANIAARSEISIKDMVEANLIEPLCSLLEDNESDVKIEAAWALFNGINGYEYGQIDVYPSENENKPDASKRILAQNKRRKAEQQRCCRLSPTFSSGISLLPFYSMVGRDRIPLMEVFSLRYLSHDELEPEKQCGTIKMMYARRVQFLYNLQEIDLSKPTLKYGDDILVTVEGPTYAFSCLDVQFDLFSGAYKDCIEIEWDYNESVGDDILYEERRIESRDGTGEISFLMGLFFDATIANLEVKLVDCSSTANVYGVILASNSKLDIPQCTSVLFEKKPDNIIQLGDDGFIPLSKSSVGVPMNSVLHVDISLNVNGVNYTATSSFIAKKTGEFPEFYSSENKVMIQVQVTWDAKKKCNNLDI